MRYTQDTTWKLRDGTEAGVRVGLQITEIINADGDHYERKVCRLSVTGYRISTTGIESTEGCAITRFAAREIKGTSYAGQIGRMAIPTEALAEIDAAITETKIAAADKAGREYDAHCADMRRAMGY